MFYAYDVFYIGVPFHGRNMCQLKNKEPFLYCNCAKHVSKWDSGEVSVQICDVGG